MILAIAEDPGMVRATGHLGTAWFALGFEKTVKARGWALTPH